MTKHPIWSNIDVDYALIADGILEENDNVTEDEALEIAVQVHDDYLEDERHNLNVELGNRIVIIADLGLWFGRRDAYKMTKHTNIRDCLQFSDSCEYADWYVDDELRSTQIHHDGRNHYVYRVLKDDVDEILLDNIMCHEATIDEVYSATESIASHVCGVYGFKEESAVTA